MTLADALSLLMHVCRPGKRCEYGYYYVHQQLAYPSVPTTLVNEHTIVLYTVGVRLGGVYPSVLVFEVSSDHPPNPFGADHLPPGLEGCSPGVCVDGRNVRLGDYKSYVYTSFAVYSVEHDDRYRGILFSLHPIRIPGGIRWLKRRELRRYLRRAQGSAGT